jgi:predicted Zn-dependent protease
VLQQIVDLSEDGPNVVTARTQLAQYALMAGKTDAANALLAEVLKANPRDNAALVLRSRIHLANGQPGDAVVDLRAALRDQQGSVELVQLLAQAHRMAKEPQLAREVLGDAIKAKPEDATLRALLAADLADAGDFKAAFAELDSAIKALPQATRLYELKSQIAVSQKDLALAQRTLEQLKAQQPNSTLAYIRLGQLFTSQKKFDAALKEYDAGAQVAPADVAPYIAAVTLLSAMNRHEEAAARILARSKQQPTNMLHRQLSAELAFNKRELATAEAEFRAVIAGAPKDASGYLGVSKVLGAKGDGEGALAVLTQGVKAVPSDRALPLARAEWLTQLKRYDEAIAQYELLRERFPEDDTVINNLAYLLAEMKGDKASTERALSLANRFAQSRNPGHLDSLGWIHYQLGQYEKAVPLLERAVALAPPSPLLQLHLGKALVKSGESARGKALIQKAIDSKANLPRLDEARALLAQG